MLTSISKPSCHGFLYSPFDDLNVLRSCSGLFCLWIEELSVGKGSWSTHDGCGEQMGRVNTEGDISRKYRASDGCKSSCHDGMQL